jgi:hypothetical protein
MATITQEIQTGLEHHQAGRLDEAERSYRQALESHCLQSPAATIFVS